MENDFFKKTIFTNITSFIVGIILVFTTFSLRAPRASVNYVDKQNYKQDTKIEIMRTEWREDQKEILEKIDGLHEKIDKINEKL